MKTPASGNRQAQLVRQLALLLEQTRPGGDLSPAKNAEEWELLVERTPLGQRELVRELARFSDLWRYFAERQEPLGGEIVEEIRGVHKLPMSRRVASIRRINHRLMRRISDAGEGSQLRQ